MIESLLGLAMNIYILLAYMGNLKNGLSLGASDKVLLSKVMVNICLHLMETAQSVIYVFSPNLFYTHEILLWFVMGNSPFLNSYSYWLIALLCVYYCVSITTCGHQTVVWLKRRLPSHLSHVLIASGFGLFVISFPNIWFCAINSTGNTTYQSMFLRGQFITNEAYRASSVTLGSFLPLFVAFISTAITLWSLINHMWTMKQNNRGFTRSKFQTQLNATRTMILFLLIAVIYNVILIYFFSLPSSVSDDAVLMIWYLIVSYPIAEAIIIIQSSSKLRRNLLRRNLLRGTF
ncbi:hypothetical protein GDO81_027798 [Engystomops pustulosus]|uniref:Taste receptor type 2 n=1 Tax=Engystomops pustulosus TaxID=76066 RepID=A0AAV6ZUA1_ENGPU|nr:hypothetical protein GDO81_027798 [Engystomops pustulosus]